jgi:hypothetical protein
MRKILFWLIAAMVSTYSAEVISGSFPFPFFRLWGWGVLMPIYGLHLIVLAAVVFRWGKPNFRTLYLAGMLFGLYEAYITKILWMPRWFGGLSLAHLGIAEVLVLVVWWHPIMSFIVPLMASERLLTQSRRISIPKPLRKPLIIGGVLECVIIGSLANSVPVMVVSVLAGAAILGIVVWAWRRAGWHQSAHLEGMMPKAWSLALLPVALGVLYIILGRTMSIEHLPPVNDQISIWVLYIVVGVLFILSLRSRRTS